MQQSGLALHYEAVDFDTARGQPPPCTTCLHARGRFLVLGTADGTLSLHGEQAQRGLKRRFKLLCTATIPEMIRAPVSSTQLLVHRGGAVVAAGTQQGAVLLFDYAARPAHDSRLGPARGRKGTTRDETRRRCSMLVL